MTTLTTELRELVCNTDLSDAAIARKCRLRTSAISRFLAGQTILSPVLLDRLAEGLDLVLVPRAEWAERSELWRAYHAGRLSAWQDEF